MMMVSGPSVLMMTPDRLAFRSFSRACFPHFCVGLLPGSTKLCLTFHLVLVLGSLYMHKPDSGCRATAEMAETAELQSALVV